LTARRRRHTALKRSCLLGAVALLAGCDRRPETFFPLDPGWEWQYAMQIVTADGPRQAKYLVANLPPYEFDGRRTIPRRSPGGATILYAEGAQGIERVGEVREGEEPHHYPMPQTVLPGTLAVGASWRGDTRTRVLEVTSHAAGALYKIEADVPLVYTVESLVETVRVPAGEFRGCLRVHAAGRTLAEVRKQVGLAEIQIDQVEWYARGVGLVRSERRETTSSSALPSGTLVVELETLRLP
jgi:hypothetical protein